MKAGRTTDRVRDLVIELGHGSGCCDLDALRPGLFGEEPAEIVDRRPEGAGVG